MVHGGEYSEPLSHTAGQIGSNANFRVAKSTRNVRGVSKTSTRGLMRHYLGPAVTTGASFVAKAVTCIVRRPNATLQGGRHRRHAVC